MKFPASITNETFFRLNVYEVIGKQYTKIASNVEQKPEFSGPTQIILPLPSSGIVDSYSLRFDEAKTAASELNLGEILSNATRAAGQATGVYDTASLYSGRAIDPNVTPLFRGIDLRDISLTWDLIPRSSADSDAAAKIVDFLRKSILPGVEGSSVDSVLSFPSAFGLAMVINGNDSVASLPVLKSSDGRDVNWVCTNFSTSYNNGAPWSHFKNGEPTSISITMQFKEMQKQTRGSGSASATGFKDGLKSEANSINNSSALEGL